MSAGRAGPGVRVRAAGRAALGGAFSCGSAGLGAAGDAASAPRTSGGGESLAVPGAPRADRPRLPPRPGLSPAPRRSAVAVLVPAPSG